ncbi:helix-turn-helix domain-containing protein [Nocardia tengchongensis]|uniref:helix-turn-helix domain-containing protein n=1 Tax=Nocardia tengchongensis TaxID=2055889 RepID=UPI003620BFF4
MQAELHGTHPARVASTPFTESDWERVGGTLRALRELRGYRPEEFANHLGISRSYLVNIEAGRKKLTNVMLARAAETLKVPQIAIMRPTDAPSITATAGGTA